MRVPAALAGLTAILNLASVFPLHAEPRAPHPPWPESSLSIFGWDEGYWQVPLRPPALGSEQAVMRESWSGYALTRGFEEAHPVAIPAIDTYGKTLLAGDTGAVRFWFNPNWSSVAKLNSKLRGSPESGPGQPTRLLEMVNLGSQFPDIRWTLHASPEGNRLRLAGLEFGKVKEMLTAPLQVQSGEWVLVTVCYSPEGSQLWIDGQLAASGLGIKAGITGWEDRLGLVVGSSVLGTEGANGQFEELALFDYWPNEAQQQFYYQGVFKQVRLGPVGTPEEEMLKMDLVHALDGPPGPPGGGGGGGGGGGTNPPAYNYDPGTFYVEILSATNSQAQLRLHNTVPDVLYELLSVTELTNSLDWQGETPFVLGTVGATSTVASVPWLDRTNSLFLQARSWADTDGDGLPDWWESAHGLDPNLADTSAFGISDGYKDADGDGWTNLEELQNGTSPSAFNTPPAPRGLTAAYGNTTTNVNVSWSKALGNLTGYTIERDLAGSQTEIQLGSTTTGYADLIAPGQNPRYRVRANYSSGNSDWSPPVWPADRIGTALARVVRGPQGKQHLAVSALPPSATSLRLWRLSYSGGVAETNFTVAVSSLTAGVYELPAAWAPLVDSYAPLYVWYAQVLDESGHGGWWAYAGANIPIPFFDGRAQLQQNLAFLMRMPTTTKDFRYKQYYTPPGQGEEYAWYYFPTNLAQASYFGRDDVGLSYFDEGYPFEANHRYRNFGFNASLLNGSGFLTTGVSGHPNDGFVIDYLPDYEFLMPTNQQSISAILGASETAWTYLGTASSANGIGISQSGGNWTLASGTRNLFGLTNLSTKLANSGGVSTLYAGGSVPYAAGVFYAGFDQPVLQTTNYYFGNRNKDLMPGDSGFAVTNTSPMLISSVGESVHVVGYAKQALLNGYAGKFGYLGQYFEKAQKLGTTNATGVLSPYGEFLPTEPGPVELVTMADLSTGQQGTGVVQVIKLQLDVNHDGVMDLSWHGPDNANTGDRPFRFWVNNDNDVPAGAGEPERDVPINIRTNSVADGIWGIIETQRNLEDLARVWIRGVPAVKASDGYAVTLEIFPWDVSDNPHIRVYRARETDGGVAYLTNTTSAANQLAVVNESGVNVDYGLSIGHISPGVPLTLPLASGGGLSRSNFLFEASGAGKGALVLTVWKDDDVVADHWQYVEFRDTKNLYERAYVTQAIQEWPLMVETNLVSSFRVQNTQSVHPDETAETAVLVHGWRMSEWEYGNFADTMFKRLYWTGYRGRFTALRWPTLSADTDGELRQYLTYNRSEHIAFKSAAGAAGYLNDLRNRFSEHTISVAAHSMGNIVMMETLKQLAVASQSPLDNYVMMQAAVPAHSFDTSVTNLPLFVSAEQALATPNTYHNYAAGVTNALRVNRRIINFFNPVDYALHSGNGALPFGGAWELNHALGASGSNPTPTMKPNTYLGYYTNGTAGLLRTNEWNGSWLFGLLIESYHGPTRAVTVPHELMPFVSRSRTKAVGTQGSLAGMIALQDEINLQSQFGFTNGEDDHSGQFNRNIQSAPVQFFYPALRSALFLQP